MKRSQSRNRAPSPTPTAFSGISNYKTDSYRPSKDVPPMPGTDLKSVSKIHFDELSKYLAAYLAKASPSSRSAARQKLTRLTLQQFHELSTDVYDELVRRQSDKAMPFLPVKEEFHPKRNQARQKLATLPTSRFEDLSSDVYYELLRRYPEFKESEIPPLPSPASNYDDTPSPDFQPSHNRTATLSRSSIRSRQSEDRDRPSDSGYGSGGRRSEDRKRPSEQFEYGSPPMNRRSEDPYAGVSEVNPYTGGPASRRKPSQDATREHLRRPSASNTSDTTSTVNGVSTTAASGMIIPNKSMMTEEIIQVPYGRNQRESASTNDHDSLAPSGEDLDDFSSPKAGGLNALGNRLRLEEEDDDVIVGGNSADERAERLSYGRASVSSDRSAGGGVGVRFANGRTSTGGNVAAEDSEKLRREYEYKIATMQSQMQTLQRNLDEADENEAHSRELEQELTNLRAQTEEQNNTIHSLREQLQDRSGGSNREYEQEIAMLQERVRTLEASGGGGGGGADMAIVDQLRSDMEGLFNDLTELQRRNDELLSAKESDMLTIRDLNTQLKEFKRKYEQAKTELRSMKATSQLYAQAPKLDRSEDELPISPDGGILDVHITAFMSAVDSLLTVGRSNAPTRVLAPMKSVVNAVAAIIDDVRAYEQKPPSEFSDSDLGALRPLCERAEATLSNLVAATKTHATSSGLSPVSLLDAAASHVSAVITEMSRTVLIRKASKVEQDQFMGIMSTSTGHTPSMRSVDETMQRFAPRKSSLATRKASVGSPLGSRRVIASPSDNSSRGTVSPPIFDRTGRSNDSASEDPWVELHPYLEAQTESIVVAIQNVLTGVRSPTPPTTLEENVTRIIAIVSSIVAVCNDNLPSASSQQGNEILRELSEHANKLSEAQAVPEMTKESRQVMAKSSFAIANAMKALMKL